MHPSQWNGDAAGTLKMIWELLRNLLTSRVLHNISIYCLRTSTCNEVRTLLNQLRYATFSKGSNDQLSRNLLDSRIIEEPDTLFLDRIWKIIDFCWNVPRLVIYIESTRDYLSF